MTFGGGLRGIGFDDEMGSEEEDVFSADAFSVDVSLLISNSQG
jgi:hypothetical protein